jgi:hypothetical protein
MQESEGSKGSEREKGDQMRIYFWQVGKPG